MKKLITVVLSVVMILIPTLAATTTMGAITFAAETPAATEVKIDDWPLMKEAIAHENAKAYDKARPYWEKLVELYASYQTLYAYENGGHYASKTGDYYAGVLNPAIFEPSLASIYYEKAYHAYVKLAELDGTTKFNWAYVIAQRKWDQISSDITLYVRKDLDTLALPVRALSLHEPESGLYIGTYGGNNTALYRNHTFDPEGIRSAYGEYPASLLYYNIYGESPFPSAAAAKMKAIRGSIQIQMQPFNLDDVKDAAYIRDFAKAAKASGIPVFLRFGGEMNGNWVPWGLQPEKYIEKFKIVHDILAKDAPNVAMVWAPNFFPWDNMANYYPGDDYVDWVGVSAYTSLSYTEETKTMKLNANPIDLLKHIVEGYGDRKPVMIVEGAVSYRSTAEPTIDYTDWGVNNLKRFYQYIPLVYPEIKAFYYYDSTGVAGDKESYMLTGNVKLKETYSDIIAGDYYLSNMEGAPYTYLPLT